MPTSASRLQPTLRLAVLVSDGLMAEAALARGAETLILTVPRPAGEIAAWRASRPGLAVHAALRDAEDAALDAFAPIRPDGILLRDARSGRDVNALGARLAVLEAEAGWPDGALTILAAIRHPLGALDARSFVGASPRLAGLGLDGAYLPATLGEGEGWGAEGFAQARGLISLAAAAAGVTVFEIVRSRPMDMASGHGHGLLVLAEACDAPGRR